MAKPFAAIVIALLLATAGESASKDDFLIIPGQRVGLLRLGMSPREASRGIRDAHRVSPIEENRGRAVVLQWPPLSLFASFLDGRAMNIVTRIRRWKMRNGLRVGSTYREAVRRLGRPVDFIQRGNLSLGAWKGMEIEFENGRVVAIAVCCD